jgi:hypothetical protein
MATSKQYVRKHTNMSAFTKHKAGLKKRNAIIDEIKGMTIKYHFLVSPSKNTAKSFD